jgi:hypothetical protein
MECHELWTSGHLKRECLGTAFPLVRRWQNTSEWRSHCCVICIEVLLEENRVMYCKTGAYYHMQARQRYKHCVKDDHVFPCNMRFSGTCQTETPQSIHMKFCKIDYVGKITRCAKNGWNPLAGDSPTDRWNITSKTFLSIPYFTLPFFLVSLYSPNGLIDVHAWWLKRCSLL